MQIPVGPVAYELLLSREPITLEGRKCRAICDADARRIVIDATLPPRHRVMEFWHEFAHACKFELDIHDAELIGHEPLARLVALGMSAISVDLLCRITLYLTRGVECRDVFLHNGAPIPVYQMHEVPPR